MSNILSNHRVGVEAAPPAELEPTSSWRSEFDADIDRIVFSDAFRRLQDKTQVHGPSGNDYVRSRLTHSMEVSRVGRQIGSLFGRTFLSRAPERSSANTSNLTPADFGQVVAAACLMHDIGNPPFGHTGEAAISEFFLNTPLGREIARDLPAQMQAELTRFEGNAQGLRVVARLQGWRPGVGMGLTAAVIAAAGKYPFAATNPRSAQAKGKYNFFESEAGVFAEAAAATGMAPHELGGWKRHPLAHLVEAADDIAYRIVDIEDGYAMRCLTFEAAEELLASIAGTDSDYRFIESRSKKITRLRSRAINKLIVDVDHLIDMEFDAMMSGDHPGNLILHGRFAHQLAEIEGISRTQIYSSSERIKNDLLAHKAIHALLGAYLGAFLELEQGAAISSHARHVLRSFPHAERVGRARQDYVRAVLDYVSGMTDAYAIAQSEYFSPSTWLAA